MIHIIKWNNLNLFLFLNDFFPGTIMVQQQQQSTQVMTPPVLGYPQCAPQGYPQPPPAPGQGYQYPPPATVQGQMQTAPAPGYAGNSNQGKEVNMALNNFCINHGD